MSRLGSHEHRMHVTRCPLLCEDDVVFTHRNGGTCAIPGAIWFYLGSDAVEASEYVDGMCTDNLFQNNYIESASLGVAMKQARDNKIISNTFVGAEESEFDDANGLLWTVSILSALILCTYSSEITLNLGEVTTLLPDS